MNTNISQNFLKRLPTYYKIIKDLNESGKEYISSSEIAKITSFNVEQVKKDLQIVSSEIGKPKIGRNTSVLLKDISSFLGYNNISDAIIIGAGHLGYALLNYQGFKNLGINIVCAFDNDKSKIGSKINGKEIIDVDKLEEFLNKSKIQIAILATSNDSANQIAKRLCNNGIKAILNFATVSLDVSDDIIVENVNLAIYLASLSHKLKINNKK